MVDILNKSKQYLPTKTIFYLCPITIKKLFFTLSVGTVPLKLNSNTL